MLARIRKSMEERDGGFTLIELLVVIIIIGILAAIAIPVFLRQRQKGYNAGAKSDLRNLATQEETYFTDANPQKYAPGLASLTDYKRTDGVKVAIKVSDDGQSYCLETYNTKVLATAPTAADSPATNVFVYDSTNGGAAATACALPTASTAGWSAWN
jgi:type IV pilus assembly protein PilA